MNKKILLLLLTLIFTLNISFVSACNLNDLSSCSFNDLKNFISSLLFKDKITCNNVYLPVCSESGETFINECFLKEKKGTLAYLGSCLEYPYNLSANLCVKEKFEWNGYKCEKKNDFVEYNNEKLDFSLILPSNSKIKDDYIELPKERNNTNLIYKKLEINSGNYCSDISFYTKVKETKEVIINGNSFEVISGENNLDYGDNLDVHIDYTNYILKKENSCIGFLFSMQSKEDSSFTKYDKNVESLVYEEILGSFSNLLKKEDKKSPCNNYGDLNSDGVINEEDLKFFDYGVVENNIQEKADLNNDQKVDDEDKSILSSFIYGNELSFPACFYVDSLKVGYLPKISNKEFTVTQDKGKTEANIRINFDVSADQGDVYLKSDLSFLNILNKENIVIENVSWNTGAVIKEDGYIFLEKGKTTWFSIEMKLKAKEKPVYSKVFIDSLNYLNEKGELNKVSTLIESSRFYLNYTKSSNLICDDYGDIDGNGLIDEEDLLFITENKELDENQKIRADVSGNGEVNLIDAIEIKRYLQDESIFTVCLKTYMPKIYENALVNVISNEDKSKHIIITFYLDSDKGEILLPAYVTFNKDNPLAGIYLEIERDGNISIENLKLLSSGEPTNDGFIRIKKNTPSWIKVEFDARAINDTALVNFLISKIIYLDNGERESLDVSNIKTGDIFFNYGKTEILSPCDNLGDLDEDGFITFKDYEYLEENLNLLLFNKEKFVFADLNKDGIINELDKEELNKYLNKKITSFSGCSKSACFLEIDPIYTKDGFIYANKCYLKEKEVKCYINKDCGL
ncbi:MAG: dockerin type I domain-containing protein [Candidatus Pacebacteria bacterium]|nr:dockerin type I domain-containing protein [Candidatus Paceibacterota bacterium]